MVQNAPEKSVVAVPSPNFTVTVTPARRDHQVVANVECNVPPHSMPSTTLKEEDEKCSAFTIHKSDTEPYENAPDSRRAASRSTSSDESLELNVQEILGLDVDFGGRKVSPVANSTKADSKNKGVFKSLPNLSASSENLLV